MYGKSGYGQNSFQRYRAINVQTASPARVLIMLYDGAIRFANQAILRMQNKDLAGKGTYIGKVQAIVSELMSSLDHSVAPELCNRLQQLFLYMIERLTEANMKVDPKPLKEVVGLLTDLRDANKEALDSLPGDPTAQAKQGQPGRTAPLRRPGAPAPVPAQEQQA